MWVLDYKESWALKNCCFWTVVLEKTLESPLDCREIQPVHPKAYQSWVFIGRTNAEAKTPIVRPHLTHLKRHWCWERLRAEGEGEDRGWDGWVASPPWWTWFWASSRSWWRIGKPGVLQYMGSQSQTWLSNWTELADTLLYATFNLVNYTGKKGFISFILAIHLQAIEFGLYCFS